MGNFGEEPLFLVYRAYLVNVQANRWIELKLIH